jgi:HSP20 family molecular chaperone IbpA
MTNTMLRHFLGFDPAVFETVDSTYPRYNIVKDIGDQVSVEIAVPGFHRDDVSVEQDGNKLLITINVVKNIPDEMKPKTFDIE